ncbi:PP2C family protein-serine/threonine phosphatase [Candidatus Lokiarchaeum ossiferum]
MVCDGVSASSHGEKGSTFVIRHLSSKIMNYLYTNNFQLQNVHERLLKYINETNLELLQEFKQEIEKEKVPKTTLVGVLVIGQWLWTFNIGDSRSFVIKDLLISQISVDDIGTGATHEITQALGQVPLSPHVSVFNWAFEGDYTAENIAFDHNYYFLICSDGLTDKVSSEEILKILTDPNNDGSVQEKVESLYILTMERKIDDNVSIIAVDLAQYFKNLSPIQIIKLSYPKRKPDNE